MKKAHLSLTIILLFFSFVANAQVIRYVTVSGSGNGSGTSWNNASAKLQEIINISDFGDEVWVAMGNYKPTHWVMGIASVRYTPNGDGSRDRVFLLKEGVKIYGGFLGFETRITDRNPLNKSTLSGDYNDNDVITLVGAGSPVITNNVDNAYHVVAAVNLNYAIIDSFFIIGGNGSDTISIKPFLGLSNNNWRGYGGGIFICKNGQRLNSIIDNRLSINNCVIRHNSVAAVGAGIYATKQSYTLSNSDVIRNVAIEGGGMYNSNSNPYIKNTNITGNQADNGAGCYNFYSSPNFIKVKFRVNFGGSGGGMYNNHSSPILQDVQIAEGFATVHGGGMYNISSNPSINNSFIFNCFASNLGGGMYNEDSAPTLNNVNIHNNNAYRGGGIFCKNSSPAINNSVLNYNYAGIYGGGLCSMDGSNPILTNVLISNNYAGADGGGIRTYDFPRPNFITLNNVIIINNSAGYGGGILLAGWLGNALLKNVVITQNTSSQLGGGACLGIATKLLNVIISDNTSQRDGGGIYINSQSIIDITNCTIYNNKVSEIGSFGGGIFGASANINVVNSIFYDNTTTNLNDAGREDIYSLNTSNNINVSFSCLKDALPIINVIDGGSNLQANPRFFNIGFPSGVDGQWLTSDDGLQLLPISPAIDRGTNTPDIPEYDILGTPRELSTRDPADMGAYEYIHLPPRMVYTSLDNKVNTYPNPTEGFFELALDNIDYIENQNTTLTTKILNASGYLVLEQKLNNPAQRIKFDISHLPSGLYLLQWNNGKQSGTQKIIKK